MSPGAKAQSITDLTRVTTNMLIFPPQAPVGCSAAGCTISLQYLIPSNNGDFECPRGTTCTFRIQFCGQITVNAASVGDRIAVRTLIDGVPPSPGPTDMNGFYVLEEPAIGPAGRLNTYCMNVVDADNKSGVHGIAFSVNAHDLTGDAANITLGFVELNIQVYKSK